jgi:hypothetical protein
LGLEESETIAIDLEGDKDRQKVAEAYNPFYSPEPNDHRTNDEGVYRISGVPPGRYIVKVGIAYGLTTHGPRQKGDVYYPETFHPDASDASKASVVEVATGHETTDVDITVGSPLKIYEITGQLVVVETGAPVPNVGLEIVTSENGKGSTQLGGAYSSNANGESPAVVFCEEM